MKLVPTNICAVAVTAAVVAFSMSAQAWVGMSMPWLHINGRFIQDPNGHNVLLRGYMQAGAIRFNGQGHNYSDLSDFASASLDTPVEGQPAL